MKPTYLGEALTGREEDERGMMVRWKVENNKGESKRE
jgi:aminopeptidase C